MPRHLDALLIWKTDFSRLLLGDCSGQTDPKMRIRYAWVRANYPGYKTFHTLKSQL